MPKTWEHPEWGRFKFDGMDWVKIVDAPGFNAFSYDTGYSNARGPKGKFELAFAADDEDDTPSPAMVRVAAKVLANQEKLVPRIAKALWDDFNGRGPESGMWWHGDLDQVKEAMEFANEDLPAPTKADDLLKLMRLFRISVRKGEDDAPPLVELCFWAAFEEEHNVGILTDGAKILGAGHHVDVQPYESD